MIALVCSAAFPTMGRIMTLMNATGMFHSSEAPCNYQNENTFFDKANRRIKLIAAKISLQEFFSKTESINLLRWHQRYIWTEGK
jgi:hypothetical protein